MLRDFAQGSKKAGEGNALIRVVLTQERAESRISGLDSTPAASTYDKIDRAGL